MKGNKATVSWMKASSLVTPSFHYKKGIIKLQAQSTYSLESVLRTLNTLYGRTEMAFLDKNLFLKRANG